MLLTMQFRLKDKHATELNRQARAVNYVWNYCNETQMKAAKSGRKWLNWIDLGRLTAGSSKELGLNSHTIKGVCVQYDRSRKQHRRAWLRFRSKKSLGWVPYEGDRLRFDGAAFVFRGVRYMPMYLRPFPEGAVIRSGSFNCDARGRWYINCGVEFQNTVLVRSASSAVGVDLGLKDIATLSTGEKIGNPRHYRVLEGKLGGAQRAGKKRLALAIATKIRNARRDHLHKASARIALEHSLIIVGEVSSTKLSQTKMAKSVLDAGWYAFKKQLEYKAIRHGSTFLEVDEAFTSQTCSACGALPEGRPKGIAGLAIRQWECSECGAVHDRDVNAAINIARLGQQSLVEGASA